MPKAEFMTPKAIANRMKAKGLQKLRWFCQLCNKQCRDENGFKCHANSESHKRQLSLFASRPGKFLDTFSHEFEKGFLDELKRRFGSKRVHANLVYNEYIRDRFHTHMNSTIWTTLTGFVKYLGRTGKAVVDETEKGWYISYINRDPEALARQKAIAKKERMDVDDEERQRQMIEKRILELAKMGMEPGKDDEIDEEGNEEVEPEFDPEKPHVAVKFSLRPGVKLEPETPTQSTETHSSTATSSPDDPPTVKQEPEEGDEATREIAPATPSPPTPSSTSSSATTSSVPTPSGADSKAGIKMNIKPVNVFALAAKSAKESKDKEPKDKDNKRKKSTMEQLMEEEERGKEKKNRRDFWITPGIVVKIMNKTLADGKYYKLKGAIQECPDKYIAQIKVLDLGDVLKLDQSQLETVIPPIGGKLKVVNGAYRGESAVLQALDIDNFSAKIKLTSGSSSGKSIDAIPYEDICKIHQ
jgi:DNA/RNA-binding protein KIN17